MSNEGSGELNQVILETGDLQIICLGLAVLSMTTHPKYEASIRKVVKNIRAEDLFDTARNMGRKIVQSPRDGAL